MHNGQDLPSSVREKERSIMDLQELNNLASSGESDRLELKKTTGQRSEAAKTICAMLNSQDGGDVVFGITNDGTITGQELSDNTFDQLHGELEKIEPLPLDLNVLRVRVGTNRWALVIRVPGGTGLHTYDGRPYYRFGSTTRVMPTAEFQRRLLEHVHSHTRWENQAALDFTLDALDERQIMLTVEEAVRRGRLDDPAINTVADALRGFRLIENGQVLNAAIMLFGKHDQLDGHFPQCRLRLARFQGTDKAEFIDNRQEIGNAFELFVHAQRFLREHLPIASRIAPEQLERIDQPLYPTEATREAIANALCHRDYSLASGSVAIAIYDDRLEISSTGNLPFGLTPEDLLRDHLSHPRNPLIAEVFYKRGLIESWGRGTLRMIELTEQAGLVPPEFSDSGHHVTVRFRPTSYVPPTRVSHFLSDLQREILEALSEHGPSTLGEISEALDRSVVPRTLQNNLQTLREVGLVELKGSRRWARWFLTAGR
jgi:ATP-dependent DNA helicase RecG